MCCRTARQRKLALQALLTNYGQLPFPRCWGTHPLAIRCSVVVGAIAGVVTAVRVYGGL